MGVLRTRWLMHWGYKPYNATARSWYSYAGGDWTTTTLTLTKGGAVKRSVYEGDLVTELRQLVEGQSHVN